MKKTSNSEDSIVAYESNKNNITVAMSRDKISYKYVLDNTKIDNSEEEIVDTIQNQKTI